MDFCELLFFQKMCHLRLHTTQVVYDCNNKIVSCVTMFKLSSYHINKQETNQIFQATLLPPHCN